MIVGITVLIVSLFVSHYLESTVGYHLIGVHIDRRSGSSLHHIDGEVLVHLAVDDFLTGLTDGTRNLIIDDTEAVIGLHGSQFYVGNSHDIVGIVTHLLARYVVVVDATLGLYAVIGIDWYFEFA